MQGKGEPVHSVLRGGGGVQKATSAVLFEAYTPRGRKEKKRGEAEKIWFGHSGVDHLEIMTGKRRRITRT